MRSRKPIGAGSFGGNFSKAATVAVIACTVATTICIVGGVLLFGGQISDLKIPDRGLSIKLASRLGSLSNQSTPFRSSSNCAGTPKLDSNCPQIENPPPLCLPPNATVPIAVLESLPLLEIEDMWPDSYRWGPWRMKRYWDEEALKNAIRSSDSAQLYPVIHKLESGQPITVVSFGSSIVADYGGVFHSDLEMIYKIVPNPGHKYYQWDTNAAFSAPSALHHRGWLELFMQYVNHTWPHPEHLLVNAGKAGHIPKNFADGSCLEYMLPKEADIVLIETMGVGDATGLENLSWRILRHFKEQKSERPAMVFFNTIDVAPWPEKDMLAWGAGGVCGGHGGLPPGSNLTDCCKNYTGGLEASFTAAGNRHPNDGLHHEMARLYGFGSISHRDFLWPYVRAKAWDLLNPEFGECGYILLTNMDSIHPSQLGKVLFADYVWTYLNIGKVAYDRRNAAHYVDSVHNKSSTTTEDITYESPTDEMIDKRWKEAKLPLLDSVAGTKKVFPLPKNSFVPNGRSVYFTRCYGFLAAENTNLHRGSENKLAGSLSGLPILERKGFEFFENTTHGAVPKRKPGWVAMDVGAYMELEIDTYFDELDAPALSPSPTANVPYTTPESRVLNNSTTSPPPPRESEIVLSFLKSYEHMGKARLSCLGGCMCIDMEIDAHHEEKTSVQGLLSIPATQSKKCRFRIEVSEGTSSGEHKFKVTQVTTRMKLDQDEPAKPAKDENYHFEGRSR
jgi:hypothetical protein